MRVSPLVAVVCAITVAVSGCDSSPDAGPGPTGPATPSPSETIDISGGLSHPVADPIYPARGNPDIDVLHYNLRLQWAPTTKTLTGVAELRIRPVRDAREVALDFTPYALDGVTVDGRDVSGSRVTRDRLSVPVAVTADRVVTLNVRYHGTPTTTPMPSQRSDTAPLGLTVDSTGGLMTMQEPFGAFTWYPANDQPSDKALYDIAVTVPSGWSAVASGTPNGREGDTFRYRSTNPVSAYLVTLAVGRYTVETAEGPHGIPVTYWHRTVDEALLPVLRETPQMLTWLEQRFGPYPFPSAGVVVVDSRSAMETQQMVTLGSHVRRNAPQRMKEVRYVVLHELAHQWFGDSVTTSTWKDMWLNEGWAMYVQLLYEKAQGEPFDLQEELDVRDAQFRADYGPPGKPKANLFGAGNVYYCPAAMLHEIRKLIGDKAFDDLAKAWVQEHRDSVADRATFIAFVNTHTGRDLTTLINTWLDSPTTPRH